MQTEKVALFGLFGGGNLGNSSTLQAILSYLQKDRPEIDVCCVCYDPNEVTRQHGISAYPIDITPEQEEWNPHTKNRKWLNLLRKIFVRVPNEAWLWIKTYQFLRKYDMLIVPGTGILDDFGVSPFQLPYDIFKWSLVSKLTRTPLYFVSIGAGPIVHPLSRFLMISALKMATFRTYRDQLSKDYLSSIGFDATQDAVYPDLVFGLPLADDVRMAAVNVPPKVIGLGIMQYYGWRNLAEQDTGIYHAYIKKITRFAAWLLESGYVVRIIIGQSHDRVASDDIQDLLSVEYGINTNEQLIVESIDSVEELFDELSKTDLVVATRFHNVLCSLMLNRPTISIGYAQKNDVLMAEMGLAEYCQQIEELDVDLLIAQFNDLVSNSEQFTAQIAHKNTDYRLMLNEQYTQMWDEHLTQAVSSVENSHASQPVTVK